MSEAETTPIRIVPLGGRGEIGKNMTAIESPEGIVVIDAGIAFPRGEMLGVDLVLPDLRYLEERADQVRAVILTHGHEDHVGALPYLLRRVSVPEIWATRLTLGMVKSKLDEHGLGKVAAYREVEPEGPPVDIGPFEAEFIRVTHSIPDAVAVTLHTSEGTILHTGDVKIDHTPIDGVRFDLAKLAQIGSEGIAVMLGDSTNAERPGWTPSERIVAATLRQIIAEAPGRVIVTSFASHIHRLQEVIDGAVESGRKVAVVGRSMTKNLNIARNLGYATVPDGTLVRPSEIAEISPDGIVLLCTGSQGEPLSALTRIAFDAHPMVEIEDGDTVILSAKPVPGNEIAVGDTINQLHRKGARVLTQGQLPVHVSGHGSADELMTVLALARPRAVIPVHGEMRHMVAHRELAIRSGVAPERVFVGENGCVYELADGEIRQLPSIPIGQILVDGLSIGEPGEAVMRDRRQLSDDGVLIVVCQLSEGGTTDEPMVIARGFGGNGVGPEELFAELRAAAASTLQSATAHEHSLLQERVHDVVAELVHERTRKRPLILPVIVDA